MRPITVSVGPLAAVVGASIALGQNVSAPGQLNLNGSAVAVGVAVLSPPARVVIQGGDVGAVYRIYGLDSRGNVFGEEITAGPSPNASVGLYKAVSAIYVDRAMVGAVLVGNDNGGTSAMIRLDEWADAPIGVQVATNGTVNFTVQHSFDDPNDLINPVPVTSMFWDTGLVPAGAIGGTAGISFSIATAPVYMRILQNSGPGSARMTVSQYNVVEA